MRACVAGSLVAAGVACGPVVTPGEPTDASDTGSASDAPMTTSTSVGPLDETSSGGTSSGGTSSGGTTSAASTGIDESSTGVGCALGVDACCCFEADEPSQAVELTCPSTPFCDAEISVECASDPVTGEGCDLAGAIISDAAPVDCAMAALASASRGHFVAHESADGGTTGRTYAFYTTGDGDAFVVAYMFDGAARDHEPVQRWVQAPAYLYESCQQAPTVIEHYSCLREGLVEVIEECLP